MPKRALIVDDSRSARVILGRMLEGYGLLVDASESAEQGIEYLRQSRPDVIFMDHLMPGMDGFQAVQAIKGNPHTATIPVVMYTSQEGELYVSQARALGAVGVLPKTVKQADVSKVLYQLRLLPERRERVAAAANDDVGPTVRVEAPARPSFGELETAVRNAVQPLLQEHSSELRRFMLASLESFARRAAAAENKSESKPAPSPATVEPEIEPEPERVVGARWPISATLAGSALLAALILAVLYTRTIDATREVMESNARLAAVIEQHQTQLASVLAAEAPSAAYVAASQPSRTRGALSELVPYGEIPLAGARLDRLRALTADLTHEGFEGKIKITTYTGEFCLTGNGFEGYSLAADDLPFERCDVVGNPFEEGMTAAQRQSLAFANAVASLHVDASNRLAVELEHAGREPIVPYPSEQQMKLTAGDWNRVAVQNNRVEFVVEPRAGVRDEAMKVMR